MILGSHVSFGSEQLLGSVKEAISYNANTFMFYTGAPQNTIRKSIDEEKLKDARSLMKENNIDINNVICHAPYIINLANNKEVTKYEFSINFLKNEIERCELLGVKYIVLHPGSAVGIARNLALDNIVEALNRIIKPEPKVVILLETMAGKGTELGCTIEEIKYIIENVKEKTGIGVCLDTCHLNDAGYDMSGFEMFIQEFDKLVGINYIKCIHINDSKNPLSSHKDRHENIGYGTIGFDNILNIVNYEMFKNIPKILETPYIGDSDEDKNRIYPPYKFEIEMIRKGVFDNNLKNNIRKYYKTDIK